MRDNGGERGSTLLEEESQLADGAGFVVSQERISVLNFGITANHIRARYARVLVFYAKKRMATLFGLHSCLVHICHVLFCCGHSSFCQGISTLIGRV